jgi:hypothetical protein
MADPGGNENTEVEERREGEVCSGKRIGRTAN